MQLYMADFSSGVYNLFEKNLYSLELNEMK